MNTEQPKRLTARQKRRVLVAAVALTGGCVTGLVVLRTAQIREASARNLEAGMDAYQAHRYAEAVPLLSSYLSRVRDNPETMFAFADSRRFVPADDGSRSHLVHALAITRLALDLEPASLYGRIMFMEIAEALGFHTEAEAAATAVIESNPQHLSAYLVRLNAARRVGHSESRIALALDIAERFPLRFLVQARVLDELIDAGYAEDDLEAFVIERRNTLPEGVVGEILSAKLAAHRATRATESSERERYRAQLVMHIERAASPLPHGADEAIFLIRWLNRNPGLAPVATADRLLERYLEAHELAGGMMDFSIFRAWQRGDAELLGDLVRRCEAPARLGDRALCLLALASDTPERYTGELHSRNGQAARAWLSLLNASESSKSGRPTDARQESVHLAQHLRADIRTFAQYIEAASLLSLGESGLADRLLADLGRDHDWVRARVLQRKRAFLRQDYKAAIDLVRVDQLAGTDFLLLEAVVSLDERGHVWATNERSGAERVQQALSTAPDNPPLLSLHAWAELAAGNVQRAQDLAMCCSGLSRRYPARLSLGAVIGWLRSIPIGVGRCTLPMRPVPPDRARGTSRQRMVSPSSQSGLI